LDLRCYVNDQILFCIGYNFFVPIPSGSRCSSPPSTSFTIPSTEYPRLTCAKFNIAYKVFEILYRIKSSVCYLQRFRSNLIYHLHLWFTSLSNLNHKVKKLKKCNLFYSRKLYFCSARKQERSQTRYEH
jgi:hypothetical protein